MIENELNTAVNSFKEQVNLNRDLIDFTGSIVVTANVSGDDIPQFYKEVGTFIVEKGLLKYNSVIRYSSDNIATIEFNTGETTVYQAIAGHLFEKLKSFKVYRIPFKISFKVDNNFSDDLMANIISLFVVKRGCYNAILCTSRCERFYNIEIYGDNEPAPAEYSYSAYINLSS